MMEDRKSLLIQSYMALYNASLNMSSQRTLIHAGILKKATEKLIQNVDTWEEEKKEVKRDLENLLTPADLCQAILTDVILDMEDIPSKQHLVEHLRNAFNELESFKTGASDKYAKNQLLKKRVMAEGDTQYGSYHSRPSRYDVTQAGTGRNATRNSPSHTKQGNLKK